MEERAFVLAPLNDIAPNLVHPVSKKRIVDLFAALGDTKSLAKKTPFVL
jgi:7,8-dihydro-6-hydroxymethylpterin-pyrophosphokinase